MPELFFFCTLKQTSLSLVQCDTPAPHPSCGVLCLLSYMWYCSTLIYYLNACYFVTTWFTVMVQVFFDALQLISNKMNMWRLALLVLCVCVWEREEVRITHFILIYALLYLILITQIICMESIQKIFSVSLKATYLPSTDFWWIKKKRILFVIILNKNVFQINVWFFLNNLSVFKENS